MEKKFQEELGHEIGKSHKTETIVAFSILGVLAVALGVGAWWYFSRVPSYDTSTTSEAVVRKTDDSTASTTETSNLKTYTNTVFNFSLKYPNTWTLSDKLPTSTTVMGKAYETLAITSSDGYTFVMYMNPDGFGMEDRAAYVSYDGTTVTSGKVTLGTRVASSGEAGNTGFVISTNLTASGNRYLPTMTGADAAKLTAADTEYKKIIASMTID